MASLKEAQRSAALTFSPTAPYLAAGTVAGAIDTSFSTSSTLEVGPATQLLSYTLPDQCTHPQHLCSIYHLDCTPVQVFKLDFSSNSHDLQVAGQPVNCPEPFHRLSWNAFSHSTPEHEKYPVRAAWLGLRLKHLQSTVCWM